MKIDTAFRKILAFLGSKKKDYQLYMEAEGDGGGGVCSLDKITKKKGVRNAEANQIGDKRVLRQLRKASSTVVSYRKLESRRHVISLIKQKKPSQTVLTTQLTIVLVVFAIFRSTQR